MSRFRTSLLSRTGLVAAGLLAACGDSPGDPLVQRLAGARLAIESGDGQTGVRERPLPALLAVRLEGVGRPVEGIEIAFVDETGGGVLSADRAVTGTDGVATTAYTPGSELGTRTIRARIDGGRRDLEVVFQVEVVDPPEVDRVEPRAVVAGGTIVIEGRNFSPVAAHDVVRVGGRRADVLEASRTRLLASVPDVGDGTFDVTVALAGALAPAGRVRVVSEAVVAPPPGVVARVEGGGGSVRLPFETGDEAFLVALGSTSLRIEAGFEVELAIDGPTVGGSRAPVAAVAPAPGPVDGRDRIHAEGRARLARYGPARPSPGRRLAPARERVFRVLAPDGGFESRTARRAFEGARVVVYVDEAVGVDVVPDDRARVLGERFEREAYGPLRDAFGDESDVDGDGRVILLMTPLVNARGDETGRVLGFFFPGDLSDGPNSNRAEIFYVQVPDPEGRYGRPTSDAVLDENVGVAAHEFVHMITTNERVLTRGLAPNPFWLEEGLAHLGEFVAGTPGVALSNVVRTLGADLAVVSLAGFDLRTRGLATLLALRLLDRAGLDGIGAIVRAPGAGAGILETATGEPFGATLGDLALALHNELFPSPGLAEGFEFFDLAGFVEDALGGADLVGALGRRSIRARPDAGGALAIRMREGALAYVIATATEGLFGADLRWRAPAAAGLQMTVVRIR